MIHTASIGFVILAIGSGAFANEQRVKRAAPKEVTPVVRNGIKYTAPHFLEVNGERVAGGYVEALDDKTERMLWRLKVYETRHDRDLEGDVQDVFITSLAIEENKLVVTNERKDRYAVDLDSHKVTRK